MISGLLKKVFGSRNERLIKQYSQTVKQINALEPQMQALDDAALRIARLAEPYPPLPKTEEDIDILHVTRTWQFLPGGEVRDE